MSVPIVNANTTLRILYNRPHLLHVSAVFGHHHVVFTITCMDRNTEVEIFPSHLIYWIHKILDYGNNKTYKWSKMIKN